MNLNNNSHKTAISRKKASVPARLLMEKLFDSYDNRPFKTLLDWGCGRGKDVEYFQSHGLNAKGYDPYWECDSPSEDTDMVTCSYVLNVIESEAQRVQCVKAATHWLKDNGFVMLTARSKKEVDRHAKKGGWNHYNDGFLTGRGTFQKGLTLTDLQLILSNAGRFRVILCKETSSNVWILAEKGSQLSTTPA